MTPISGISLLLLFNIFLSILFYGSSHPETAQTRTLLGIVRPGLLLLLPFSVWVNGAASVSRADVSVLIMWFIPVILYFVLRRGLYLPKRPFAGLKVAYAYDKWTTDGILEYYWGDHIHLGYYSIAQFGNTVDDITTKACLDVFSQDSMLTDIVIPQSDSFGLKLSSITQWFDPKDSFFLATVKYTARAMDFHEKRVLQAAFQAAKITLTRYLLDWSGMSCHIGSLLSKGVAPKILDCGCGVGGASRIMGKMWPECQITGISISQEQVSRATQLTKESNLENIKFLKADALKLDFEEGYFDAIFSCECLDHIDRKHEFMTNMHRLLKPGGIIAISTWCTVDSRRSPSDMKVLNYVFDSWCHPPVKSIKEYMELMEKNTGFVDVKSADWTQQTLPSWRHSILVGIMNPMKLLWSPLQVSWNAAREVCVIECMHNAFRDGLLVYGALRAIKAPRSFT